MFDLIADVAHMVRNAFAALRDVSHRVPWLIPLAIVVVVWGW